MNEIERLQQLDRRTSRRIDSIDVTDNVLRTLHAMPPEANDSGSTRGWIAVAVAGWCVALGLTFAVQQSLASFHDPLAALMR